ncbi:MAG TPA: alpha/beta hydrolase [Lachnospiraceae bacterium]|nr:alpha/beta hydrolase [Lachnospiraceae bacterium]
MKKTLKAIGILSLVLLVLVLAMFIYHRMKLSKEKYLMQPLGELVEVNGHNMSIYTEGEGSKTLVFLSGGGTSSPILDFRSLYSLLSEDYKIVVVEKFGYGFSDIVDEERPIEVILGETRAALTAAGIEGPYVLCPHSMSGIEAIYWAQSYPEEVEAIIGLDMAVPASYENYKINMPMIKLGNYAINIGLTRWIPGVSESDAMKYGTLTEEEKEICRAVFFSRTATITMMNEVEIILENAQKVGAGNKPDIPMLLFISNGTGTSFEEDIWRQTQKEYLKDITIGSYMELDCPHYVHDYEYERISQEMIRFLADK